MNILESLYYGNIAPINRDFLNDDFYQKLDSNAAKDLKVLAGLLENGEKNKNLIRYEDSSKAVESYRNLLTFIDGFHLGAKIALEIAATE